MEREVHFDAGDLRLHGHLYLPARPAGACVILHPHPLYGGNMDNNVVAALAGALGKAGLATFRFDFRGVGRSAGTHAGGRGEIEDARAAAAYLAEQAGTGNVVMAGYSFGAAVALAMAGDDLVGRLIAVAPPLSMMESRLEATDRPVLLVAGDRDPYCPAAALQRLGAEAAAGRTVVLSGADHFLAGREDEIGQAAVTFVSL